MHTLPDDIERASMEIIRKELDAIGVALDPEEASVTRRVLHATADFDFAGSLVYTAGTAPGVEALKQGAPIVLDTNMAKAGVSRPAMEKTGTRAYCYMADEDVGARARSEGTTRAVAAVRKAVSLWPTGVYVVGNAPTALLELADYIEKGFAPRLVIGVPVGFVNVVESKERILEVCRRNGVPLIASMGRKGGSTVAAAICNALLYTAADRRI